MKRAATTLLFSLVALVASATLTNAALRVPQVPVIGGGLQAYLISVGESINVNTDQDATQTWSHTISGTTTYTIQFQSSPNAATQQFGLYNASAVIPPLFFLMSGSVGPLGFSTATFQPGNILVVNRFDALGNFLSTTKFGGVDPNNFGFYLSTAAGHGVHPGCAQSRQLGACDHVPGHGCQRGDVVGCAGTSRSRVHPATRTTTTSSCSWIGEPDAGEQDELGSLKARFPLDRRSELAFAVAAHLAGAALQSLAAGIRRSAPARLPARRLFGDPESNRHGIAKSRVPIRAYGFDGSSHGAYSIVFPRGGRGRMERTACRNATAPAGGRRGGGTMRGDDAS
jgi:hypothetical protein